jgi:hypothetical protein
MSKEGEKENFRTFFEQDDSGIAIDSILITNELFFSTVHLERKEGVGEKEKMDGSNNEWDTQEEKLAGKKGKKYLCDGSSPSSSSFVQLFGSQIVFQFLPKRCKLLTTPTIVGKRERKEGKKKGTGKRRKR